MGLIHTSVAHNHQTQIQLNNWIEAIEDPTAIFSKVNPYRKRLLINKINNELIEQYDLQFMSEEDFKMFVSEIELRKESNHKIQIKSLDQSVLFRTSPYIYRIKYFLNTSVEELCSTIHHGLLYISKVELRLKQINDIPFDDVLYLYKSCFQGFKILYEHYGSFTITEEMIFFDKKGKVKVWINPNLSKNYPNYQKDHEKNGYTTIQVKDQQHEMIQQIVTLIRQNTDEIASQQQIHFKQYLERKIDQTNQLTFHKVLEIFYNYVQDFKLNIGSFMKSIYDLYHQDNDYVEISYPNSTKMEIPKMLQKTSENKVKDGVQLLKFNSNNTINIQNKQRQIPKFTHKNNLQSSKASKRSYNSEFNIRTYENNPKMQQLTLKREENNLYLSQKTSQASHFEKLQQYTPQYHEIKPNSQFINRNIITFCPPQNRVLHPTIKSQIAKYKSLEKYPHLIPNTNETKSITFSYQSKNTVPVSAGPSLSMNNPYKQSFQVKVHKKESFIDKLNFNTQTNTIKISNPNLLRQNLSKEIDELKDTKKISYFSSCQAYILDKEIAQDMQKYLGFNPNQI